MYALIFVLGAISLISLIFNFVQKKENDKLEKLESSWMNRFTDLDIKYAKLNDQFNYRNQAIKKLLKENDELISSKNNFEGYKKRSVLNRSSWCASFCYSMVLELCEFMFGKLDVDNEMTSSIRAKKVADALGYIHIKFEDQLGNLKDMMVLPSVILDSESDPEKYQEYCDFCSQYQEGMIFVTFQVTCGFSLDELAAIWYGVFDSEEGELNPEIKKTFEALKDAKERSILAMQYNSQATKAQTEKNALINSESARFIQLKNNIERAFNKHLKNKNYPFDQAVSLHKVLNSNNLDELIKAMSALN